MSLPRIALTPGEPAGIGPDLIVQLAQHELPAEIVVIAPPQLLQARAKLLNLPLQINYYDPNKPASKHSKSQLTVLPMALTSNKPVQCGVLDVNNSAYVIQTLERAMQGCLQNEFAALVTGPVHKAIINAAGIAFTGHTEFFAHATHSDVVMLMVSNKMRVALATTHVPLRAVADLITPQLLTQTILVLQQGLAKYFHLTNPKILVCGLNPHAGEDGHLGREEIEVISPTLEKLRSNNINLIGPVPADTAFIAKHIDNVDVVLVMYHDQGLPVLKYADFETAINVTLGLPFLRTSVDHGSALDLAGTGKASTKSLLAAIQTAVTSVST